MKKATVQITYPSEKMEAIRQYIGGKDADMNAELEDALNKIYNRVVPKDVRSFLEAREAAQSAKPPRPLRQAPPARPERSGNEAG